MAIYYADPKFRIEFETWVSRYLSGDNCQPFFFDWTSQELAVRYDLKVGQHVFNLNGWATAVSLGSLIAHINLFAYYKNIDVQLENFEQFLIESGYCLRCRFDFNKEFTGSIPRYLQQQDRELVRKSLFERKTIREELDSLSESQLAFVLNALVSVWPHSVYLSKAKYMSQIERLLQIESIFYKSKEFFAQTFNWIRTSQKEYQRLQDGMYIGDLGLKKSEQFMTIFMKKFVNFSAWLLKRGAFRQALRVNKMQLISCDGVVMFWANNDTNTQFIELGREVSYFLVYLWSQGIGAQPVSLLTQYMRENWNKDSDLFKIKDESALAIINYFKAQGINGPVLWGLRIGKVKKSFLPTLRRSRGDS